MRPVVVLPDVLVEPEQSVLDACCKLASVAVLSDVELTAPEYVAVADRHGRGLASEEEEALEPALEPALDAEILVVVVVVA